MLYNLIRRMGHGVRSLIRNFVVKIVLISIFSLSTWGLIFSEQNEVIPSASFQEISWTHQGPLSGKEEPIFADVASLEDDFDIGGITFPPQEGFDPNYDVFEVSVPYQYRIIALSTFYALTRGLAVLFYQQDETSANWLHRFAFQNGKIDEDLTMLDKIALLNNPTIRDDTFIQLVEKLNREGFFAPEAESLRQNLLREILEKFDLSGTKAQAVSEVFVLNSDVKERISRINGSTGEYSPPESPSQPPESSQPEGGEDFDFKPALYGDFDPDVDLELPRSQEEWKSIAINNLHAPTRAVALLKIKDEKFHTAYFTNFDSAGQPEAEPALSFIEIFSALFNLSVPPRVKESLLLDPNITEKISDGFMYFRSLSEIYRKIMDFNPLQKESIEELVSTLYELSRNHSVGFEIKNSWGWALAGIMGEQNTGLNFRSLSAESYFKMVSVILDEFVQLLKDYRKVASSDEERLRERLASILSISANQQDGGEILSRVAERLNLQGLERELWMKYRIVPLGREKKFTSPELSLFLDFFRNFPLEYVRDVTRVMVRGDPFGHGTAASFNGIMWIATPLSREKPYVHTYLIIQEWGHHFIDNYLKKQGLWEEYKNLIRIEGPYDPLGYNSFAGGDQHEFIGLLNLYLFNTRDVVRAYGRNHPRKIAFLARLFSSKPGYTYAFELNRQTGRLKRWEVPLDSNGQPIF